MKNSLFWLALTGMPRRKRNVILLFLVLLISLTLAIVIVSVTRSIAATNEAYRLDTYGRWDYAASGGSGGDEEYLSGSSGIAEYGTTRSVGKINGASVGVIDDEFVSVGNIALRDGRLPENDNEIAMEADLLSSLGYDYTIGQTVTVNISLAAQSPVYETLNGSPPTISVTREFTLCGVLKEYTDIWTAGSEADIVLNSAVITDGAAGSVISDGEIMAENIRAYWQEHERDENSADGSAEGSEENSENAGMIYAPDITLSETLLPEYFIVASDDGADTLWTELNGHFSNPVINSTIAADEQDVSVSGIYIGIIFAATIIAVISVYCVELQSDARRNALFRCIGISNGGLIALLLYETIIICVPAMLLSLPLGAAAIRLILKLAVFTGSANIVVVMPVKELLIVFALWLAGIAAARTVVFLTALRKPLRGRVSFGGEKSRIYRAGKRGLTAVLCVLFCAAIFYTVQQCSVPLFLVKRYNESSSYVINEYISKESGHNLNDEMIDRISELPGVVRTESVGILQAELIGGGSLDESALFNDIVESDAKMKDYLGFASATPMETTCVYIYAIGEDKIENYFDADGIGVDLEKFISGDEVVVNVPLNADGTVHSKLMIGADDEDKPAYETKMYGTDEIGLTGGDVITLSFYTTTARGVPAKIGEYDVSVGGVLLHSENDTGEVTADLTSCYSVLCSMSFIDKVLLAMPEGHLINSQYLTGAAADGYCSTSVYTDLTADYLGTDTVLARLCGENGFSLQNMRETRAGYLQTYLQELILVFASGGSAALILFLVIVSLISLDTEHEAEKYSILQALGMSRGQTVRRVFGSALLGSVCSAIVGWGVIFGFLAYRSVDYENPYTFIGGWYALGDSYDFRQAFDYQLYTFKVGGLETSRYILITVLCAAAIIAVYMFARRKLFSATLMEKLREE